MADTSYPGVDPELLPLLEGFPPIDVNAATLAGFREAIAGMSALPDPASHADVSIETIRIAADAPAASELRCLLYRPVGTAPSGTLLHIHGGGYVMGLPEMDTLRNVELVRRTGCAILSVDYRLAPEHPFPAALEDCHAAALWLAEQADSLGIPAGRIGVIGESAGAGLAALLALAARDRGGPALACQVLIYPMLMPPAHSAEAVEADSRTGRHIWSRVSDAFGWSAFLPGGEAAGAAGLARNLSRLPPAFLAVGELDLFVHDNLAFASRLMRAGVSVELHLYPGAFHGFDRMADAAVSARFTRELAGFVAQHLGRAD